MSRLFVLLFLIFKTITPLRASDTGPKGSIAGRVTDVRGEGLPGVTVALKGTVRGTVTDGQGRYHLDALPAGTYTLVVSGIGLKSTERPVAIEASRATTADVQTEESAETLAEVTVSARQSAHGYLAEVEGFAINATKKNEVIQPGRLDANLTIGNAREVFSRTPGIQVWENDGSGVQINVAARGLSPNRSWEFNVRQNGYDVSSDPMGYPEAYYNPPMEAVERIELVRGAAALQYGPQFGGLLNYVLKGADPTKPFSAEASLTGGSYGLRGLFAGVGGTTGKLSYYASYHHRQGDGWRQNGRFEVNHGYAQVQYALTPKLKVGGELTLMNYVNQQPGGLTDAQFAQDARQSSRFRNWFSTPWVVPALTAEFVASERTKFNAKVFSLVGERNSIGFTQAITVPDVPNAEGRFANRQIDRDLYRNWGTELRLMHRHRAFGLENTLSAGLRYFDGRTDRRQQGRGDAGSGFNLDLQDGQFPRDLSFRNQNGAVFAENLFKISEKWLFTAGLRLEHIELAASGRLGFKNGQEDLVGNLARSRSFVLGGLGAEYHVSHNAEFYANASQAFRPVTFADLTPPATTDVIDQNLRDARGLSADFGYRGTVQNWLRFDVGLFYLTYANRIGTLTQTRADGTRYQFRTNLGRSVSQGAEAYAELDLLKLFGKTAARFGSLTPFASLGFTDATYRDFRTTSVSNGQVVEGNLSGKRVENAPRILHRFGLTYARRGLSATWQMSRVGAAFADASNTETPNAAATTGLIPAYAVQDVSLTYRFARRYIVRAGINNLTDARYFTRRAGGYPGPGLLPADGRTGYVSVGLKL
jgi:Fe(3+) dicitrate transport protein